MEAFCLSHCLLLVPFPLRVSHWKAQNLSFLVRLRLTVKAILEPPENDLFVDASFLNIQILTADFREGDEAFQLLSFQSPAVQ